jgi:hypothetical protein
MGALGEVGGCQIALFGQTRLNEVDCRDVGMIFHAKNCLPGAIFCARTQFNTSFGNVVARAVHANVQLHHQSWECVMKTSHNINPRINIGSMH